MNNTFRGVRNKLAFSQARAPQPAAQALPNKNKPVRSPRRCSNKTKMTGADTKPPMLGVDEFRGILDRYSEYAGCEIFRGALTSKPAQDLSWCRLYTPTNGDVSPPRGASSDGPTISEVKPISLTHCCEEDSEPSMFGLYPPPGGSVVGHGGTSATTVAGMTSSSSPPIPAGGGSLISFDRGTAPDHDNGDHVGNNTISGGQLDLDNQLVLRFLAANVNWMDREAQHCTAWYVSEGWEVDYEYDKGLPQPYNLMPDWMLAMRAAMMKAVGLEGRVCPPNSCNWNW